MLLQFSKNYFLFYKLFINIYAYKLIFVKSHYFNKAMVRKAKIFLL